MNIRGVGSPSFAKGGEVMTTFEGISLMISFSTLVLLILSHDKNNKK
ncbi:putative holin-like toxin [Terribacillus saccharophilus]